MSGFLPSKETPNQPALERVICPRTKCRARQIVDTANWPKGLKCRFCGVKIAEPAKVAS